LTSLASRRNRQFLRISWLVGTAQNDEVTAWAMLRATQLHGLKLEPKFLNGVRARPSEVAGQRPLANLAQDIDDSLVRGRFFWIARERTTELATEERHE
jgi:hypothetical protein